MATTVTLTITPVSVADRTVDITAVYVNDDDLGDIKTTTVSVHRVDVDSPAAALDKLDRRYQAALVTDSAIDTWLDGKEDAGKAYLEAKYA